MYSGNDGGASFSEEDLRKLYREYIELKSIRKMARRYGVSYHSIREKILVAQDIFSDDPEFIGLKKMHEFGDIGNGQMASGSVRAAKVTSSEVIDESKDGVREITWQRYKISSRSS